MVVKKYLVIDRQAFKNRHYKNDPTSNPDPSLNGWQVPYRPELNLLDVTLY